MTGLGIIYGIVIVSCLIFLVGSQEFVDRIKSKYLSEKPDV
jgi:hypothetical protein